MTTAAKPTLLIVDDEPANLAILSGILKAEHTVLVAKSGPEALARLNAGVRPDLILLDVMMPGMDGYEVLRRIKEVDAAGAPPVMFVTALDAQSDEERGLTLGAVDYITKPYHPAIVKARVANHMRIVRQMRLLENLAHLDPLTEIANRRRLDERLALEWARARRSGQIMSLAVMDIDDFKAYNDRYGHAAGDGALRSVAQALSLCANRPGDVVARTGGEEFIFLAPETDVKGARHVCESVVGAVRALAIPHASSRAAPHVTISVGGATCIPGEDMEPAVLLEAADAALYRAKHLGRNQVVWSDAF